jgi:polyisoprenyl-phosphate glycosyltransferase
MLRSVAILIPCFNEAANIDALFERLLAVTVCDEYSFSYLFVDDGSLDSTIAQIKKNAETRKLANLNVIELSRNFGKEAALTAGLDFVATDACIILDADLQDPPEVIPTFLRLWNEGFEVIAARREHRPVDNVIAKFGSRGFYWLHNLVSEVTIPANVGDARLIDRKVIEALRRLPENRRFMKGLFAWVGFQTVLVDVTRQPRYKREINLRFHEVFELAIHGVTSFTSSLLRLWTVVGLFVSAYAFLHGSYIGRVILKGIELPGYASLTVLVLFFSVSR